MFHDSLFELSHLGRITDLIVACVRTALAKKHPDSIAAFDERSLRALLANGVSGIFQSLGRWNVLPPVLIECGLDSEKIILGVSWSGSLVDSGVENSLRQDREFLEWLKQSMSYSTGLQIRVSASHPSTLECLFTLPILGHPLVRLDVEQVPWEVIQPEEKTAPAGEYFQLGDVNYPVLLKDQFVGASQASKTEERRVISGVTENRKDEVIRVQGGGESSDSELIRVNKRETKKEEPLFKIGASRTTGGEKSETEHAAPELSASEPDSDFDEEPVSEGWMSNIIKKIWPFKEPESSAAQASNPKATSENPENWIMELQREQEQALDKTLNSIKSSAEGEKSKRWVDGLMGEILAEKSRLQELGKKLALSIKQKEFEFKTNEKTLREELRRKEEKLQKTVRELRRAKEKSDSAQQAINKGATKRAQEGNSEESNSQLKQKYHLTQQLLTAAKLENSEYKSKIDELRGQLTSSMLGAKQQNQSVSEIATLKSRLDRMARQADELKKVNHQLNEKLNELKKEGARSANEPHELREKLESSLKTVVQMQKENLKLQTKVEELQREEMRLKLDLGRAQEESKQLKLAAKAGKKNPPQAA